MKTKGKHVIADFKGCSFDRLDDIACLELVSKRAVMQAGMTLLNLYSCKFEPYGVSITATLSESHLTVHTWPEDGYAAVDVYTCGNGNPEKAVEVLEEYLQPTSKTVTVIPRG